MKKIDANTDIYCILGYPVRHSKSPMMHNKAFEILGINACYVAFEIRPGDLGDAIKSMKALGIKGANITIPFKEDVIPLLDSISDEARDIGAVNTIKNDDGILRGFNTDGVGFVASLKENLINPKGLKVLVLGAGGASRAIVYSLIKEGAHVYISNRTMQKAILLCNQMRQFSTSIQTLDINDITAKDTISDVSLIVNTTSLGLKPDDPLPIPATYLGKQHIVCDIIYKKTPLLKEASRLGIKTIDGSGMLLHQGVIAFEIWTGLQPPVEEMRKQLEVV